MQWQGNSVSMVIWTKEFTVRSWVALYKRELECKQKMEEATYTRSYNTTTSQERSPFTNQREA